jgi:hypothetical protein
MATDDLKFLNTFIENLGKDNIIECSGNDIDNNTEYLGNGKIYKDGSKQQLFTDIDNYGTEFNKLLEEIQFTYKTTPVSENYFTNYRQGTEMSAPMSGAMSGGGFKSDVVLSDWNCDPDLTYDKIKDTVNPIFAAALLDMFGVKSKTNENTGITEVSCATISPQYQPNIRKLLTTLASVINSDSGILNSSQRDKYFNVVSGNWADKCDNDTPKQATGLQPFCIKPGDKSEPNWNAVQKNMQMSSYYPIMPATQIQSWGMPLGRMSGMSGGDATTPITFYETPKLSSDVSKILRTLLDNLKSNGVDLSDNDKNQINNKLGMFQQIEKELLGYSLAISTYNRVVGDNGDPGTKTKTELENITRQYEQKMKKYSRMQTGFEKVVFAILQNCSNQ